MNGADLEILIDEGQPRGGGPLIIRSDLDLLWNRLAREDVASFRYLEQGLKDLVRAMADRKILAVRTIRNLAVGFGYQMNLREAKETFDAVLGMVAYDARVDLATAFARNDTEGVERNAALLRKMGAVVAPISR